MSINWIVGAVVALVFVAGGVFIISQKSNQTVGVQGTGAGTVSSDAANSANDTTQPVQATVKSGAGNAAGAAPATQAIPGTITATVVDQYGNPVSISSVNPVAIITDSLGQIAAEALITSGTLKSEKPLSAGTYTIDIPDDNPQQGFTWGFTPFTKQFQLPAEGINLGKLVITRWGNVIANVTNAVGTQVSDANNGNYHIIKCEISDPVVRQDINTPDISGVPCDSVDRDIHAYASSFGGSILNTPSEKTYFGSLPAGSLGTLPAGSYTIEFQASGYTPTDKSFTLGNNNLDLGTIVLQK